MLSLMVLTRPVPSYTKQSAFDQQHFNIQELPFSDLHRYPTLKILTPHVFTIESSPDGAQNVQLESLKTAA